MRHQEGSCPQCMSKRFPLPEGFHKMAAGEKAAVLLKEE